MTRLIEMLGADALLSIAAVIIITGGSAVLGTACEPPHARVMFMAPAVDHARR